MMAEEKDISNVVGDCISNDKRGVNADCPYKPSCAMSDYGSYCPADECKTRLVIDKYRCGGRR